MRGLLVATLAIVAGTACMRDAVVRTPDHAVIVEHRSESCPAACITSAQPDAETVFASCLAACNGAKIIAGASCAETPRLADAVCGTVWIERIEKRGYGRLLLLPAFVAGFVLVVITANGLSELRFAH